MCKCFVCVSFTFLVFSRKSQFRGQSRSPNMESFDMSGVVSYQCTIVTLSLRHTVLEIFDLTLKPGLSRTDSEINGDSPPQCTLRPAEWFPSNQVLKLGVKNQSDVATELNKKKLTRSSALWIQSTNAKNDRRTDKLTPDDSNNRAYSQRRAIKTKLGIQRHLSVVTLL